MAAATKESTVSYVDMSEGDRMALLAEKRSELLNSRRSHKSGELANPRTISALRKEVARLLTAQHQAKRAEKAGEEE